MVFQRRAESNGVKKGRISEISAPPRSQAVQDSNRHTVSYVYDRSHTVLVEYLPDAQKDMFQVYSLFFCDSDSNLKCCRLDAHPKLKSISQLWTRGWPPTIITIIIFSTPLCHIITPAMDDVRTRHPKNKAAAAA